MVPNTIIVRRVSDDCTRKFVSHANLGGTKQAAELLSGKGLKVSILTGRGTTWRLAEDGRWRHDTGRVG